MTLEFVGLLKDCNKLKKVYVWTFDLYENHTAVKNISNIIPDECPRWKMDLVDPAVTTCYCSCDSCCVQFTGIRFERGE